jgi:pimeloyl-ACP methyl ester carboxylesterase
LWTTPERRVRTHAESARVLAKARAFHVTLGEERVAAWSWGPVAAPALWLVHGWSGRASQLTAYVEPLVALGWRVLSFDLPGHGTSTGNQSSLPELGEALLGLGAVLGPPAGVVAHSIGGAALTLAGGKGLPLGRVVLLAPPSSPRGAMRRFAEMVALPDAAAKAMERQIESRLGFGIDSVDILAAARQLTAPAMIVHDAGDTDVPYAEGAALSDAWPNAHLRTTHGLGHRRVLFDRDIVAAAARFIGPPPV